MKRRIPALLVAALFLFTGARQARAESLGVVTLTDAGGAHHWSGHFQNESALLPEECLLAESACDQLLLNVDLPESTWSGGQGGMLVTIKWPTIDAGYDLDLYVYDEGETLVARADTVFYSHAEAVWLERPRNGVYRIFVVPKAVVGPLPYEGRIHFDAAGTLVEREQLFLGVTPEDDSFVGFPAGASPELLPNLVPTRPQNFRLETGVAGHFYVAANRGVRVFGSCYPHENLNLTADDPGEWGQNGAVRCLRWDQGESNLGDGPFELRAYSGEEKMQQVVYRADGGYGHNQVDEAEFAGTHGHFHYKGFNEVTLFSVDAASGQVTELGRAPDKGFCAVDIVMSEFGSRRAAPNRFRVPGTCDAEVHNDPDAPGFEGRDFLRLGISVGWADVYPWFIFDQYMEIDGVPDGVYAMRSRVDVAGLIRETNDDDNCGFGCLELSGDSVQDVPCPANIDTAAICPGGDS